MLIGEVGGNYRPWGHHANWRDPALGINSTPEGFGNTNRKMANFVMVDGSVRTLSNSTSLDLLKALSTPAGGEKLPDNWDNN
jgi:prepilin-type processing-associated H-X9-DG protein